MSNWHTRRFTQDYREHERDLRHDEPRPGERGFSAPGNEPPARLDAQLSNAMDIALLVRGMSNVEAAANLIDSYADLKAAGKRLDAMAAGARP